MALILVVGCTSGGEPPALDVSQAVAVTDAAGREMGSVAFPVSCGAEASAEVRLGLALLHNMTYPEAEQVFTRAAAAEPGCAMAYWGMAMTYLHPLWPDVPTDERLAHGWELLQEARSHGLATEREDGYVEALEAYYRDAADRTERERLGSYAEAWREVRAAHPSDPEATLFTALSILAQAQGGADAADRQLEAGSMAETVLAAIPDHPGAHHYVIHAFDSPPNADRALAVARRYGRVAPENSHALHMTSHIFTRRGLWEESIEFNRRAAEAAGGLGAPSVSYEVLHATDYLVYAHLQRGEDDLAAAVLARMQDVDRPIQDHAASAYAYAAVEARLTLERSLWSDAAAIRVRWPEVFDWDRYPHLEAIQVFARAVGAARSGDLESARAGAGRLAELESAAESVPDAYDWATQVRIQEIATRAWITLAEGRSQGAVGLMREAADLEATTQKNPVTPGEVVPAGELLGDMMMELERYAEALVAYNGALERTWNRFNSLYGAARAAEALENDALAADYYRQLLNVAAPSAARSGPLERARAAVTRG